MRVTTVTITRAATIPTGSFANQRLEITWTATLEGDDKALVETSRLADALAQQLADQVEQIREANHA